MDANSSKRHLYDLAKRLDIAGRSSMSKEELVQAVQKADRRQTAGAKASS